ncbi:MAG TPA: hypothetical protein VNA04_02340 [Thermoanaerobaculia bacterium]|nr:hypothetical protein [Thermoanaerobaculia bacterium]
MSSTTPAAILSAAISTSPIEPTAHHLRRSASLRVTVRRRREPLDLEASLFRYLVGWDGSIQPVREIATPFCRCARL